MLFLLLFVSLYKMFWRCMSKTLERIPYVETTSFMGTNLSTLRFEIQGVKVSPKFNIFRIPPKTVFCSFLGKMLIVDPDHSPVIKLAFISAYRSGTSFAKRQIHLNESMYVTISKALCHHKALNSILSFYVLSVFLFAWLQQNISVFVQMCTLVLFS